MISQQRINALIDSLAIDHNVERLLRQVEAEALEEAVKACKAIEEAPRVAINFYDPDEDGERRGAALCAAAIRALKKTGAD